MSNFTHLHVHSQYSLLDGKATVSSLIDKAVSLGMRGIAITDHGNMFGIKELCDYTAKINGKLDDDKKFTPIIGCEMYCTNGDLHSRNKSDARYHLIVLAKNKQGYKNLIKLVSIASSEGFYTKPRTDHAHLEKYREGLIVCSACLGGEIPQLILAGELEQAEEKVKWFKNVFGDDYYIELQRHETFKQNANRETFIEQQKVNKVLIELARNNNIKVIATNDVHFLNEDDAEAHDNLICVSMGKTFNEERLHYTKQEWLKSQDEMQAIFSDIPEALDNTMEILSKVEIYSIDHEPIMPTFEIPSEFGTEDEYRNKFSTEDLYDEFTRDENGNVVVSREEGDKKIKRLGGYDKLYRLKLEADYLNFLTYEGAKKLYGDPIPDNIRERLNFELYIMKTMGFPGYFLIVQDFINVGREKLGVSVGPGRGSAAGSCAAYCLGITQIDPVKYDLLFERFLNPDRISLPDIDVDFDDDGRYKVLKYVTEKYGEEKVAHIITFQTMATKSAIRDVAKVHEVPIPESNRLTRLVPDRLPDVDGKSPKINFKNCTKYDKSFAAEVNSPNPTIREVMKYAGQLEGNVRGTGVHACGVIICRDDITDWVPIVVSKDADGEKVTTTQYEGSVIESTGLIKMDFLGLKTLSIIMETLENIRHARGIELDIDHIPLDDPKTFQLYCEGKTTGTFQFESVGMQNSLRKLQPSKFEDLIAMNALYRPGPMDYIPSFIARKHGEEPIAYDIPIMKQYLEETYGITVYQEQVMLLSRLLANFTRGESDMLRKAMGKKKLDLLSKLKVKFMDGGQKNGHKAEVLEKIWADWEKFASYAFNKSHATCYSWVAYQTAYLKANYPAEYMAGVLSRNLTATDKLSRFMDECVAMGISVKCPDVNESVEKFGVNKNGEIRFGLGAVRGVGANAVAAIVREREENGPYKDIYDFVERVNLSACNRSAIESLALAGAFDCFNEPREMYLAPVNDSSYADALVKYGQRVQKEKNSSQASLFGDYDMMDTAKPPIPKYEKWSNLKILNEEKRMVSIYLSAHPLDEYYMELNYGCNTLCSEYKEKKDIANTTITMGGLVSSFLTKVSKSGRPYGVLELEDFSGKAQIYLFDKGYEKVLPLAVPGASILLTAAVTPSRFKPGETSVTVTDALPLDSVKGKIANTLTISLERTERDESLLVILKQIDECKSKDRLGDVFIKINDFKGEFSPITLHARKRYPITKELVTLLNSTELKYEISTSH
ncbi:MAG: DNA polymerase III subunit alpha [Prevotella sp.]|nr:DNA polymerase III subunit alpha [Bacteroides sp.]MCM1365642.1 DNA polymerase III subunit alpha [Prevotella sp.]